MDASRHDRSLLDDLGEEVTGIIAPVSLCMALTVLLVKLLNPEGESASNTVYIASIAYAEDSSDSSSKKFGGALLNAIIFVSCFNPCLQLPLHCTHEAFIPTCR